MGWTMIEWPSTQDGITFQSKPSSFLALFRNTIVTVYLSARLPQRGASGGSKQCPGCFDRVCFVGDASVC